MQCRVSWKIYQIFSGQTMSLIHLEHDFGTKLSAKTCVFGFGDVLLEEVKPLRYIILLQGACQ